MLKRLAAPLSQSRPGGYNPLMLAALASLWTATVCNWPLWQAMAKLPEMQSARGVLFITAFCLAVALLMLACLALIAFRRSIKPAIAVVWVSAALGAHFMGTYGVVIDTDMITNVLQSNVREARDLMSLRLLGSVLVLAALPMAVLCYLPVKRLSWPSQVWRNLVAAFLCGLAVSAIVLASFADLSATMRNHKSLRYLINPLNSFYALGWLGLQANARPEGPPTPVGLDVHSAVRGASARPALFVLVVGETARADHFALNGYARATNPALSREDVLSFQNVSSCGTSTAASLPCMFSHLGRKGFEARARDSENLLDLAQRAGLAVLWVDNQAGCKGVCDRVPSAAAIDAPSGASAMPAGLCSDGECFDEALLHGLDQRLMALPAERRTRGVLLVLHQMGSHGPAYYKRSPPNHKPFQPECATNVLQQCERQTLINAYDNSIAYTDQVLAGLIAWLKSKSNAFETGMLYVSDHGESLGENNLYLHGLPYALAPREQTHVPMIIWLAPQTQATLGLNMECLRGRLGEPLSHDHLFHSVLGALQLQAAEYQRAFDLFEPCSARRAAVETLSR